MLRPYDASVCRRFRMSRRQTGLVGVCVCVCVCVKLSKTIDVKNVSCSVKKKNKKPIDECTVDDRQMMGLNFYLKKKKEKYLKHCNRVSSWKPVHTVVRLSSVVVHVIFARFIDW